MDERSRGARPVERALAIAIVLNVVAALVVAATRGDDRAGRADVARPTTSVTLAMPPSTPYQPDVASPSTSADPPSQARPPAARRQGGVDLATAVLGVEHLHDEE